MEGHYYFGEHLRWNLGWSNPNQSGAFVAMFLAWCWMAACVTGRSWWSVVGRWFVLALELGLWFLLCKTYSRGALVAALVSGVLFFVWLRWTKRGQRGSPSHEVDTIRESDGPKSMRWGVAATRVIGIAVLLGMTDFFARVDPRFVSQDASAGNRLALWKGGLQMIHASPWQGWGVGQSGVQFSHWFQDLSGKEKYAGMVNSYLHVGVERGLPMLVLWLTMGIAVVMLAFRSTRKGQGAASVPLLMGAGCSILTFMVVNVFSTLWIFKHLWWQPALAALVVICVVVIRHRKRAFSMGIRATMMAATLSSLAGVVLYAAGAKFSSQTAWIGSTANPPVSFDARRNVVTLSSGQTAGRLLFFPENSVLGDDWGKEIRRLAMDESYRAYQITIPLSTDGATIPESSPQPTTIVACGNRWSAGFQTFKQHHNANLLLLHPVGIPEVPEGLTGSVSVMLPMLDTRNAGRPWKALCREKQWKVTTNPGVGQDVRAAWPKVLE